MEVIYALIPGMVLLGLIMLGVFVWAAKSGQFDDMEGDGARIIMEDDDDLPDQKPVGQDKPGERES